MSIEVNKLSISDAIAYSLSKKADASSPRWLSVALVATGLVILCLAEPHVSSFLSHYVPGLNSIIGPHLQTYIVSFGLISMGFIGLLKQQCAKRPQWRQEDNLLKLFQREKGEKLTFENGKIKTMGFGQRLLCSCVPSYSKRQNRQLREAITDITSQIKLDEHSSEVEKAFVKQLFFEKLPSLSRKIYKRKLDLSVINYLKGQVAKESNLKSASTENFKQIFESACLWARLGNFKRPEGGVGGSYAILDGASGRLGIYKPYDEDTLAANNPFFGQKVKYVFAKTILYPFSRLALESVGGQAYIAEAAATKVSHYVTAACKRYYESKGLEPPDLEFVPETQIVSLRLEKKAERVGSFQLWVNERHQTASQYLHTSRHYAYSKNQEELTKKLSQELFDIMAIIDFVTGNFDRHGDNWFIMEGAKGIRLIDGGWAMAPAHPKRWHFAELKNQYLWKKLPLADAGFSELGQFVIKEIFENREQLGVEIVDLYKNRTSDGDDRAQRMKERIQALREFKEKSTKKSLAEIKTARDFSTFLT